MVPPQRTACSPNRSVSVSSLKVVSRTPGAGAADALGPGEGQLPGLAGGVLRDGDQAGDALALLVDAADEVAGAFGGDHEGVHARRRHDLAEVDVEAVAERDGVAALQIGRDVLLEEIALELVIDQDHDDVGLFGGLVHALDDQARLLGLGPGLGAGAQADPHIQPTVVQVERVGVSLGAVADDGELLPLKDAEVGVVVVKNLRWHGQCVSPLIAGQYRHKQNLDLVFLLYFVFDLRHYCAIVRKLMSSLSGATTMYHQFPS